MVSMLCDLHFKWYHINSSWMPCHQNGHVSEFTEILMFALKLNTLTFLSDFTWTQNFDDYIRSIYLQLLSLYWLIVARFDISLNRGRSNDNYHEKIKNICFKFYFKRSLGKWGWMGFYQKLVWSCKLLV